MKEDPILERSLLNVKPVTSVLPEQGNCECMKDPILALSLISAKPVKSVLVKQETCGPMNDPILERSLLNVKPVTNDKDCADENDVSTSARSTLKDLNPSHTKTFTSWICQDELSSYSLLVEHYDNHMKYVVTK
ncbi:hypothetical protein ACROYT_G024608 [Oculina patagonica]